VEAVDFSTRRGEQPVSIRADAMDQCASWRLLRAAVAKAEVTVTNVDTNVDTGTVRTITFDPN
jgi:hypothetical protein